MRVFFLLSCLLLAGLSRSAAAATEPRTDEKSFDLPAGLAEFTLKSFSSQSGLEVVFSPQTVAGIRTLAVKGQFRPIQAVELMLAGTLLMATQDSPTAAIVIAPKPSAQPERRSLVERSARLE